MSGENRWRGMTHRKTPLVASGSRKAATMSEQEMDLLLCAQLGDEIYPCGIIQILDALGRKDRHIQMQFTLALRLQVIGQTYSQIALSQLHAVLFGMTNRQVKEAALRALGVIDTQGVVVGGKE